MVKRKDKKTMFTVFVDSREISHLSLSLNTVFTLLLKAHLSSFSPSPYPLILMILTG